MQTSVNKTGSKQKVIAYFEEAGLDYTYWDKALNMHFGYYKWGLNPFNRSSLLQQMNQEILNRLEIDATKTVTVVDAGCGLGSVSRYIAGHHKRANFLGFTITPWQVEFGNQLTEEAGLTDRVKLYEADFAAMPIDDESADAVFAMESACYAEGADKAKLARELYRVLKPGARFAVADGFRNHSKPLPKWLDKVYQKNMDCWALSELADVGKFAEALRAAGFSEVKIEDISWRVAPSFAHVPFVTLKFYFEILRKSSWSKLHPERRKNAMAPILGAIMGLARNYFGYYIVSGRK